MVNYLIIITVKIKKSCNDQKSEGSNSLIFKNKMLWKY